MEILKIRYYYQNKVIFLAHIYEDVYKSIMSSNIENINGIEYIVIHNFIHEYQNGVNVIKHLMKKY